MSARLAVSIGCPSGVGAEVALGASGRRAVAGARVLLVGDARLLRERASLVGVDAERIVRVATAAEGYSLPRSCIAVLGAGPKLAARDRRPGLPTPAGGAAQLAWIDAATDLVVRGEADALVTGPVSKEAIASSGAPGARDFIGHTEHLATRTGAREVTMAFATGNLTVSLVTTHLRLRDVPRAITARSVARAAYWTARFLHEVGGPAPRIAVTGLNPHAGEGGLFGDEERKAIAPGIDRARARLVADGVEASFVGPMPAEAALRLGARGDFDGVVAMFHDQATIACKLIGFGEAVNVSLGLPIVRTSVDHGTAYDRAGTGSADPSGMRAALELAVRAVRTRLVSSRTRPPAARRRNAP